MQTITSSIKQLILNLLRFGHGDWWVEVTTSEPSCIYYFGPFVSFEEANTLRPGYIQDLMNEGARSISTIIKRCQPNELTKCEDA